MNIRTVTPKDAESLGKLVMSLAHFYLTAKTSELPQWFISSLTHSEFLRRIESAEYSNYLYEIDDTISGYIALKNSNHLYHLFVSDQHQGKGIGKKLWLYAKNRCDSQIFTLRSSLNAVQFYKKLGFIESGVIQEKQGIHFQSMEHKA